MEHGQPGVNGQLHKTAVRRWVHSAHAISVSPFEYHSETAADLFGLDKINQVFVLQFAVNWQGAF